MRHAPHDTLGTLLQGLHWHHKHDAVSFSDFLTPRFATSFEKKGAVQSGQENFKGANDNLEEKIGIKEASKIKYTMRTGKEVSLCGDNKDCCQESCKKLAHPNPRMEESQASQGSTELSSLGATDDNEQKDCFKFCSAEFSLLCFPGDSTVIVRDRGRVPLAELKVGDAILSVRSNPRCAKEVVDVGGNDGWELYFDEVLAFLHREPSTEAEFLQVRHEAGHVHLTPNHLLFAQSRSAGGSSSSSSSASCPTFARDVNIGDRLLVPWIDGSFSEPEVLEVTRVKKCGVYAPLLESGAFIVDGAVVSCYAIPDNIKETDIFRRLSRVASARSMQATYHALFLPLRLACRVRHTLPYLDAKLDSKEALSLKVAKTRADGIHPYGWTLYAVFSSLLS